MIIVIKIDYEVTVYIYDCFVMYLYIYMQKTE